jgi:hypothetical protein
MATAKRIGNYEILAKIGQGGMGAVFKARQVSMDRIVALKVLPPRLAQDESFVQRFLREAKSAGQCSHANLIGVYDFGEVDGCYFFSMEFVDGPNLRDFVTEHGPLGESVAIEYMIKVAQALEVAHRKGIVHRDVKPDNILVGSNGEPKLADLGLAKPMDGDADITLGGKSIGTPAYMSPEQARGDAVDGRADLYCLGSTFWYLLTGEPLFQASTSAAVLVKQVTETPRSIRQVRPEISVSLEAILDRLLQKDPARRYPDAESLIRALAPLNQGGAGRTPMVRSRAVAAVGGPRRAGRSRGTTAERRDPSPLATPRRLLVVGGILAGLLVVTVVIVASALRRGDGSRGPDPVAGPGPGTSPGTADPVVPPPPPDPGGGPIAGRERQARDMIAYALKHAADHPEDFAGTLRYLRDARQAGNGTVVAFEADKEIERVRGLQTAWTRARWLPCVEPVRRHLDAGRFDEALAVLRQTPAAVRDLVMDEYQQLEATITERGGALLDGHLREAVTRIEAGDLAGARAALAAVAAVPYAEGLAAREAGLRKLEQRVMEMAATEVARAESLLHEAAGNLLTNLMRRRFDKVDEELAALRRDGRFREVVGRLDCIPAIVQAFADHDAAIIAAAESQCGKDIAVQTVTGTTEGRLDRVERDPRSGEPVLRLRKIITMDGMTGSTLLSLKFSCLTPDQLRVWSRAWKADTADERFSLLLGAIHTKDVAGARRLLGDLTDHPLAALAEERVRILEIGATDYAAEQAWSEIERQAKVLDAETAPALAAALTAYQTAHGASGFFVRQEAAFRALVKRCQKAQGIPPPVPPAGGPDAVVNGAFTDPDLRPWQVLGDVRLLLEPVTGQQVAGLYGPSGMVQPLRLVPGRRYLLRFRCRAQDPQRPAAVSADILMGEERLVGVQCRPTPQWEGIEQPFTAADAAAGRPQVRFIGREVMLDDVAVVPAE